MFVGPHRCFLISLIVYTLTVTTSSARLILEDTTVRSEEDSGPSCPVLADEPVGEVMERICDMCHELSSHSRPNMRVECR